MNTISKLIGCPVGGVIRVAFQHPSWGDGLRPAEKLFVKSIFRREILVCQLTTICSEETSCFFLGFITSRFLFLSCILSGHKMLGFLTGFVPKMGLQS